MANNETIADIIAEMRDMGNYQRYSGDHARVLAVRLEAAHKRELSRNASKNGADFGQLGDAAKLREALVQVQKKIKYLIGNLTVPNSLVASRMEINGIINAALSAPVRNCDKYATADEALKAQEQMFNDSNFANGECKLGCPECDNPRVGCKIAWLYAPTTEQEGGNNGK